MVMTGKIQVKLRVTVAENLLRFKRFIDLHKNNSTEIVKI